MPEARTTCAKYIRDISFVPVPFDLTRGNPSWSVFQTEMKARSVICDSLGYPEYFQDRIRKISRTIAAPLSRIISWNADKVLLLSREDGINENYRYHGGTSGVQTTRMLDPLKNFQKWRKRIVQLPRSYPRLDYARQHAMSLSKVLLLRYNYS